MIYYFKDKYSTAAEFNRANTGKVPVEVFDYPKQGDHHLTHTWGDAYTNSLLETCINVHGLASSVPFEYIKGLEVTP